MHIPDGFVDGKTAIAMGVVSAAGIAVAMRQVNRTMPRSRVPLLGLSAAFVFAAQMINFPVAGGTSGHLIGAVLVAALLGLSSSVIVMTVVLAAQCLLFADGGLTALGANVFNMALVAGVAGGLIYRAITAVPGVSGLFGRVLAGVVAGWCGTVLASVTCSAQLVISGIAPWSTVVPAMVGVHMLIGVGEGLITGAVLAAVGHARPDLLGLTPEHPASLAPTPTSAPAPESFGSLVLLGLIVSVGVAVLLSPLASSWPDGLERVAEDHGFIAAATDGVLPAPVPDYAVPGISTEALATALAGLLGTLVVFVIGWVTARGLVRRPAATEASTPAGNA